MDYVNRNKSLKERIYINKDELGMIEGQLSLEAHVKRYAFIRQYAHGKVLDCACGCGYGTYMLSNNPDVKEITGVDISIDAINHANENFKNDKINFICSDLKDVNIEANQLISLETIEHLKQPIELIDMAFRNNISEIILCYPTKKSTHYNKFHYHDFNFSDIKDILKNKQYEIYDYYEVQREVMFIFAKLI